ncbi:MAG: hypothetical protein NTW60_03050 [Candidatus Wolfebacteria bacterium]|nr:hypothetical protein [Candidatus Wolfebacteria bacterium]
MEPEELPEQKSLNHKRVEGILDTSEEDLPEEILGPLIEDIDNPRSFSLLV